MALSHPLRNLANPVLRVLQYFSRYHYPLTLSEIHLWQERSSLSLVRIQSDLKKLSSVSCLNGYYFLPGHRRDVFIRRQRLSISQAKLRQAVRIGDKLRKFSTLLAVYVTGALSMSNSPPYDDIDLMLITRPHTLWITRLLVIFYLRSQGLRRPVLVSEHDSPRVSDTACDNLWLDSRNLALKERNLYFAHELLQAKCLWQRDDIQIRFLRQNSWIKSILPVAYRAWCRRSSRTYGLSLSNFTFLLAPLNLLFFLVQYLYMLPRKTTEKVGPGYAFFHPRSLNSG